MSSRSHRRRSQLAHGWGILLGLAGMPVLPLMSKLLPSLDVLWQVLLAIFALLVARSLIGYLFPGRYPVDAKSRHRAASQTR